MTIQAQILELMVELQEKYGTAIIMITHDLGVVSQLADKVMVIRGSRRRAGHTDEVFYDPLMPYSWSLLRLLPRLDTAGEVRLLPIEGYATQPDLPSRGMQLQPPLSIRKGRVPRDRPGSRGEEARHTAACILSVEEIEENKSRVDEELGVET